MPSHSPHRAITLVREPLMAQLLRVKIMHLKGAMMHMTGAIGAHKERVMIHIVSSSINVRKEGNILLLRSFPNMEKVTGYQIERGRIEGYHCREVFHT